MRPRVPAALAGMAAAGLSLGLAELAAALVEGVPSLVTAVASYVIPFVPPSVEDVVIRLVGTSDKAVLAFGTVVITLIIGAVAGVLGRRNRANATTLFALFGVIGFAAAAGRPLTNVAASLVTTGLAMAVGLLALIRMLAALGPAARPQKAEAASDDEAGPEPDTATTVFLIDRRRFVGTLAGVSAAAAVSGAAARIAMRPPPAVTDSTVLPSPARALPALQPSQQLAVEGLTPLIVPQSDFYRIDTALAVPRVDPSTWSLRVHGLVDNEVELTYSQLLAMPLVERDVTIACVSNEVGGHLVGNGRWLGVPLTEVLALAGVHRDASQIVGRAVDGWTAGFPAEAAFDGREALVAVGLNGEALNAEHGFPARLIVPGLYGYVSATKWLTEIELTTWDGFDGYWVPRGWAKEGPIKTQSRIDVPRAGRVTAGDVVVAGVAWAPRRGIAQVEVRVDGDAWQPCELSGSLGEDAWVQWMATVAVPEGRHRIEVRATDGAGNVQPQDPVPPRPDGAEGWDAIVVTA